MKVTVCELRNDPDFLDEDWKSLAAHVQTNGGDLVVLPEMPFYRWLPATTDVVPEEWVESVRVHADWLARLAELGANTIIATQPVIEGGQRFNEGIVWTRKSGKSKATHRKRYLPEESGFWEASWYSRGGGDFTSVEVQSARVGFMICTEMWFLAHAREYGKQGVHFLASPRATLAPSVDKWLAGGRAAAVVSGAFCLSSNFSGSAGRMGEWGGTGWIIEPQEGEVLGTTSRDDPFLTLELDPAVADAAKSTYPRYVLE